MFEPSIQVTNADTACLSARMIAGSYDLHMHDTYSLVFMRRGTNYFTVRGRNFAAQPGEAFILHPFELHGGGNDAEGIVYDVLYPSRALMRDLVLKRSGTAGFPRFGCVMIPPSQALTRAFTAVERLCDGGDLGLEF
jgi:hypothetical protein